MSSNHTCSRSCCIGVINMFHAKFHNNLSVSLFSIQTFWLYSHTKYAYHAECAYIKCNLMCRALFSSGSASGCERIVACGLKRDCRISCWKVVEHNCFRSQTPITVLAQRFSIRGDPLICSCQWESGCAERTEFARIQSTLEMVISWPLDAHRARARTSGTIG